ncbi:unnamed protein product [Schistosoma haematobium]|nr:unnamed protein product [Schistosoma haematobium]CAH8528775.1 unnamed protein product [Schistosoma haematobium]
MSSFCLYGILFLICAQSVTSFRKGSSVCLLDYDEGICRALIKRFYYDRVNKTCEVFYYGGCLGNRNNFLSKQECEQKCNGTIYIKENSSETTRQTETTSTPTDQSGSLYDFSNVFYVKVLFQAISVSFSGFYESI